MDMAEEVMIAGIGCRAGVSRAQVEAAIEAAIATLCVAQSNPEPAQDILRAAGRRLTLTAIATPAGKIDEPGIQAAAAARGVPLLAISQACLEAAAAGTVTRSAHSMAAMNVQSVAEAAALAGASEMGHAACATAAARGALAHRPKPTPRLLQPRVVAGAVTCALADITTS